VTDKGDPTGCTGLRKVCDSTTRSASSTLNVTVRGAPKISTEQEAVALSSTTAIDSVGLGDDFDLRIVATNTGASLARSASITIRIPDGARLGADGVPDVPASCDWNATASSLTCAAGDLAPGASVTYPLLVDISLVCTLVGDINDNVLTGTSGDDVICGSGVGDTINGDGGDDKVYGY